MQRPTRLKNALLSATLAASMLAPQTAYAAWDDYMPWNWGKSKPVAAQSAPSRAQAPATQTPVKAPAPKTVAPARPAAQKTAAPPARTAPLEQKVTVKETAQPCPDGGAQPCVNRTYGITSPKPGLDQTYVTKHNAAGDEIERVILNHTYTPVKNGKMPFADRFVHNASLGTYVAILCPGEYLKVHTPQGKGNESYIIDKRTRNTIDEVAIGKDFTVTHQEIMEHDLDGVDLLYDVILKKGEKDCASYKAEIVAFAKERCDPSDRSIPTPRKPIKGATPQVPGMPEDEITVFAKKPRAPATPYWEFTALAGAGTDQFTGTQQVHTATGGIVDKATDPAQYDLTQIKMQLQNFGPHHNAFINYAGTVGNDAGSPTGTYGALCSQSISANALGVGVDLTTGPVLGPLGVGAGGRFENKTIKTWDNIVGETSKQSNQEYGARGFLTLGSMDKSFGLFGAEYWIQPINEKYQTADGKPYTARSSTEGMLTFIGESRLRFGKDDRGTFDVKLRYSPEVTTLYTSDGQELTSTSRFWNAALGGAWMFGEHWGIYGQAKFAHNEETFTRASPRDPSKDLVDKYKHDGQTVGIGLIWRSGK